MTEREPGIDAVRHADDPSEEGRPRTKRELARRSDGDEIGGEEFGPGAPTENPEQFQEFVGTEPEPEPPADETARRARDDG